MNPTRIGNEADAPVNDPDDRPLLMMDSIVPEYQGRTIEDVFNELVLKLRENIVIRRFERYELGA
jgi:hypothetical protein